MGDCKDTDGAKAIADFKQCANFSATIQSIAKQCQQLKTKGLDACVQQLNHFINANKKNEDKETSTKMKQCVDTSYKSAQTIKKC
ncbi:unnamed protein product [Medioppia subpectinata]|uniref:Uncharacterized protein n=1 Tax=Medioppia subpectinata TaxID=1979941 RepID=A0A7R9Q2C6_9ACAR|nr:unnamed protein product [Medioppia subpectinata]CAG2109285.1 unnamed protein product [Medioppia subpectinata]